MYVLDTLDFPLRDININQDERFLLGDVIRGDTATQAPFYSSFA